MQKIQKSGKSDRSSCGIGGSSSGVGCGSDGSGNGGKRGSSSSGSNGGNCIHDNINHVLMGRGIKAPLRGGGSRGVNDWAGAVSPLVGGQVREDAQKHRNS